MPTAPYRRSLPHERLSTLLPTLRHTLYPSPPDSHASVRTLSFNPLGSLILTGGSDRLIRVWNPERPILKNSTELRGHTSYLERAEWDPTRGDRVASVDSASCVKFWDVRTAGATGECKVGGSGYSLCWSPDADTVVVGRKDDTICFIDTRTLTVRHSYKEPIQTNQIAFSHDGTRLFLTTGNGTIKILSYPSLDLLHTLKGHTSACWSLSLSPTGQHLAVGASDALISLWNTKEWICEKTLDKMDGPVRNVSFSFDGLYVLGGSDEGAGLEIANVETGEYINTIKTDYPPLCVNWHPSRYWIAYAGHSKGLMIVGASGGMV